jgi:hypothetical protein
LNAHTMTGSRSFGRSVQITSDMPLTVPMSGRLLTM